MTVKWIRRIRVVDCKIIQIVLFVVRRSMEKKLCRFLCAAGGSGGTSSINLHQKEGVCSDDTSCNSSTQPQLVPSPASVFLTFQMCFFTRWLNRPDDPVDRSMHGQEQDSYSTLFISMYWCKCVECCSAQQCTCHPGWSVRGPQTKHRAKSMFFLTAEGPSTWNPLCPTATSKSSSLTSDIVELFKEKLLKLLDTS